MRKQIVIDIDEDTREWLIDIYNNANTNEEIPLEFQSKMLWAIANGTVLEPHGRLIDADAIIKRYGDSVAFLNGRVGGDYINAPTILEAWRNKE